MKFVNGLALTLLVLFLGSSCSPAGTHGKWSNSLKPKGTPGPLLMLSSNGTAKYTIVIPAKPTPQEEKAAKDLAQWLKKITEADFPIVSDAIQSSGKKISIGNTKLLKNTDIAEKRLDLGNEGYAIAVSGGNLFLLGGKLRGPIYAVYALLEEDLGCRWYDSPGPGTNASIDIPRMRELKFRPVTRHFVPMLDIRDINQWDAFGDDWQLCNRMRSVEVGLPEEWGGYANFATIDYFVHTYNRLVPPGKYFDAHPEYYALVDGKRQVSQLCVTNPEVTAIVIQEVKRLLRENSNCLYINVSPNDGRGYCECPNCKAIDDAEGTVLGSSLALANKVADAIADEFPRVKVTTLAYLDTVMPPKTARPRKNVDIWLCTDSHAWTHNFRFVSETEKFQKALKAWEKTGASIYIWDYTVDYVHYPVPMINMPVVAENMRFYIQHGARGVFLEGSHMSNGGENGPMRAWVWAKQLWDPSRDTRQLMHDFIYGYYKEAADPIWEYNDMLWKMWEYWHSKPHTVTTPESVNPLNAFEPCGYRPDGPLMSEDFLNRATKLFDEAKRLAKDTQTRRRVEVARFPIVYVKVAQALGYYGEFGEYHPGKIQSTGGIHLTDPKYRKIYKDPNYWLSSPAYERFCEYRVLLGELERMVKELKIGNFGIAVPKDETIRKWHEVLSTE